MASVQFGHVYQVRATTDDRGGLGKVIGYAHIKTVAEALAKGKGWYGGDAAIKRFRCVFVKEGNCSDSPVDVYLLAQEEPISPDDIKDDSVHVASGLAKLDPEEKRALGLAE